MDPNVITVVVGIFSGRPNPELQLSGSESDELAALLKASIGREPIHAPPAPKLGQFYGFTIHVPPLLANQLDIPSVVSVHQGVVRTGREKDVQHWRDVGHVQNFLIERAYRQGHGDLLEKVGVRLPAQAGSAAD